MQESLPVAESVESVRRFTLGRVMAAGGIAVAGGLTGLGAGAHFPTKSTIGAHHVETVPALSHQYKFEVFDDSNYYLFPNDDLLGATVRLTGLPASTNATKLDFNSVASQDARALDDPAHLTRQLERDVKEHLKADTLEGLGIGILLGAGFLMMSEERRQAIRKSLEGSSKLGKVVVAVGVMGILMPSSVEAAPSHSSIGRPTGTVTHVFDKVPELVGTRVYGDSLQALTDQVIGPIVDFAQKTDTAYSKTKTSFNEAFAALPDSERKFDGLIPIMVISDIHCNIGMVRVLGAIAKAYDVAVVFDAGDDTFSGTEIEAQCISALREALKHFQVYVAPGNHDSATTIKQYKDAHFIVADGTIITLNHGITSLGAPDPRRSDLGLPTKPAKDQLTQLGDQLYLTACEKPVDVQVTHDLLASIASARAACANLTISGHTHVESAPQLYTNDAGRTSYAFVSGTSGGARPEGITIGPLKDPAKTAIFWLDGTTHKPVQYVDITANPNTSVTISPIHRLEQPRPYKIPRGLQ